jgi:hypothetical protein
MLVIIYLFLLVFLLVLFIFFTAIGLTLKLKVQSLKENKEFGGIFTVKWLLFSHTFLIEEPKAKKTPFEEPEKSKTEKVVIVETGDRQDKKGLEHTESRSEEIPKTESKEKTGDKEKIRLIDRIRGKKRVKVEDKEESKKVMTTREMLYWGMEAFKSLRKPLFRLFSDLLNGIKIKRLESCITFGLSDPADTGLLCGLINAIEGFFYSRCRHCSFSINPVFLDPMLDFQGSAEVRVKIYSLFLPFIKFIFNWKTLSFTYSLVKEILQREWISTWKPRLKSTWKSNS